MRNFKVIDALALAVGTLAGVEVAAWVTPRHTLKTKMNPHNDVLLQADTNVEDIVDTCHFKYYHGLMSHQDAYASTHFAQTPVPIDQRPFSIKRITLSGDPQHRQEGYYGYQNTMFAAIDSNLGALTRLLCNNRSTMTASLDYYLSKPLEAEKMYLVYSFCERSDDRSMWVQSHVFDRQGDVVMTAKGRFVQIAPQNTSFLSKLLGK